MLDATLAAAAQISQTRRFFTARTLGSGPSFGQDFRGGLSREMPPLSVHRRLEVRSMHFWPGLIRLQMGGGRAD